MVVIVGYFSQGQDERLQDEPAVLRAVDAATEFLLDGGWTTVLVEINNECDTHYEHAILQPHRVHAFRSPGAPGKHVGRQTRVPICRFRDQFVHRSPEVRSSRTSSARTFSSISRGVRHPCRT